MNYCVRCFTFAAIFLLSSLKSHADLKLNNNSTYNVIVAIGYVENGVKVSEGWFILHPGEIKTINSKPVLDRYYYYYAVGNGTIVWSGDVDLYICSNQNFKIKGNSFGSYSGVRSVKFKLVDIGGSTLTNYTISLNTPIQNPNNIQVIQTTPLPPHPTGIHQAHEQRIKSASDN